MRNGDGLKEQDISQHWQQEGLTDGPDFSSSIFTVSNELLWPLCLRCWEDNLGKSLQSIGTFYQYTFKSFMLSFLSGINPWNRNIKQTTQTIYYTVHRGMPFFFFNYYKHIFRWSLLCVYCRYRHPNWPPLCMSVCVELQLCERIGAHIWIECRDLIIFHIILSIVNNWPNWTWRIFTRSVFGFYPWTKCKNVYASAISRSTIWHCWYWEWN